MNSHDERTSSSLLQPLVIIFGLILALAVVASLIFGKPVVDTAAPVVVAVAENIKPVAIVEVAAPVTQHVAKSGAEVVKGGCAMCHEAGLMNAPKIGDKGQWAPRIALGYETLVSHAVNGIRSMPAKGGNPDLSEEEIAAAVAEMANQSGAQFDPAKFVKAKAS